MTHAGMPHAGAYTDSLDLASAVGERDRRSDVARDRARQLWDSLCRARNERAPQSQAYLEDAVFGFYLPRARAIAGRIGAEGDDAGSFDHAAELALAKAVLAWQREDPERFDRFLHASITSEFRNLKPRRRPGHGPGSAGRSGAGSAEARWTDRSPTARGPAPRD